MLRSCDHPRPALAYTPNNGGIVFLAVSLAGCKSAAKAVARRGNPSHHARIRNGREFRGPPGSEVHGEVGAFEKVANSADRLEIHIFVKREGKAYPRRCAMLQALKSSHRARADAGIRNRKRLTRSFSNYRHGGVITHIDSHPFLGTMMQASEIPATANNVAQARLAIILEIWAMTRRPRKLFSRCLIR